MEWIKKKNLGFYFETGNVLCMILGLILFISMISTTNETTDKTVLVLLIGIISIVCGSICLYKDFFKSMSLISFIASTITLFAFICGRVSYVAFYLSGDVMGTGLSPLFVLSFVFLLMSFICSIVGMTLKQEK